MSATIVTEWNQSEEAMWRKQQNEGKWNDKINYLLEMFHRHSIDQTKTFSPFSRFTEIETFLQNQLQNMKTKENLLTCFVLVEAVIHRTVRLFGCRWHIFLRQFHFNACFSLSFVRHCHRCLYCWWWPCHWWCWRTRRRQIFDLSISSFAPEPLL